MDKKTIVKEELIGKHVIIKKCTDPNWINKSGTVIDETKNTFLIEMEHEQKRITKHNAIFEPIFNNSSHRSHFSPVHYNCPVLRTGYHIAGAAVSSVNRA